MESKPQPLPFELWPSNYDYPDALFADRVLAFDGIEQEILMPITPKDRLLLMARYAVVEALDLDNGEGVKVMLARNEREPTFSAGIRSVWRSRFNNSNGLEWGDIELVAEELGVYEIIWPFDPELMEEAANIERQLTGSSVA